MRLNKTFFYGTKSRCMTMIIVFSVSEFLARSIFPPEMLIGGSDVAKHSHGLS